MRFILFVILLCISVGIKAKNTLETYINNVEFSELNDITARVQPLIDKGGEPCALIKISVTNSDNLKFKGSSIFKEEIIDNSIWLWVLDGTRKIEVSDSNMHPVEINFADYGYPSLHGKITYQLNITMGYKSEKEVYKDVIVEKNRVKTKYVDTFDFKELKTYWFINYQFQYGYPLGINFGGCKKYGAFVFLNYVNSDIQFGWEEDETIYSDSNYRRLIIFGAGPMFRLNPHFYLQTGIGLCTDGEDTEWYFTGGTTIIYKVRHFNIGAGYYYNGASSAYNRNVFLDGLTVQIGLNF